MTTISLCMIVKNEEVMLPDCLESVKDWVDEIIIADTGSTDKTIEICEQYENVKLVHFKWIDDFAAARNFVCKHATCDYILVMDADERLSPGGAKRMKLSMETAKFEIGLIPLHQATSRFASIDEVVEGSARRGSPVLLPRMLLNSPELQYIGAVHEQPKYPGRPVDYQMVPADLVHSGADAEWRQARGKNERNLDLLLEHIDNFKELPLYWAYLASELSSAGKNKEMVEAIEKGWEAVKKGLDSNTFSADSAIASIYPGILFTRGKFKEGLEALQLVMSKTGENPSLMSPNLMYFSAYFLSMVEVPESLREVVFGLIADTAELCIDLRNESFLEELLPGVVDWRAKELLGLAKVQLKQYDEAVEVLTALHEERPDLESTTLWLAEAHISRGTYDDLRIGLTTLIPLLENTPNPDPWILASAACVALQEFDDARNFWEQGMMRAKLGLTSLHRQRLFNGLITMFNVLDGKPTAGKGAYGVLGAIMAHKPLQSFTPVPMFVIRQVVMEMIAKDKPELIDSFFEPRAEQILPGVGAKIKELLEEMGVEIVEDGEIAPVFIGGKNLSSFCDALNVHPNFNCQEDFGYHNVMVEKVWNYHLEQQLNQDFFSDSFGWLSESNKSVTDEMLMEGMKQCMGSLFKGMSDDEDSRFIEASEDNSRHFNILSQLFPRGRMIQVIQDPRQYIAEQEIGSDDDIKNALIQWNADIEEVREKCSPFGERYMEVSIPHFISKPQDSLARVLAFLGEAWNDSLFDAFQSIDNNESWKDNLSTEHLQLIESTCGELMVSMGFALSSQEEPAS